MAYSGEYGNGRRYYRSDSPGDGAVDRTNFAEMSESTLAHLEEAKTLFTKFVHEAVFVPGEDKARKAGGVQFHLTGAAYSALSKWVKATYPGSRIHRVVLSADQKAAHPKYSKKASKVVFADFTVSCSAHQVAVAAGWPAPVQPPAKAKK